MWSFWLGSRTLRTSVYPIAENFPFFLQLFEVIWETMANPGETLPQSCAEKYEFFFFALYGMKFDLVLVLGITGSGNPWTQSCWPRDWPPCGMVFGILSSLAIILLRKRELVALLLIVLRLSVFCVCFPRCRGLICSLRLWQLLVTNSRTSVSWTLMSHSPALARTIIMISTGHFLHNPPWMAGTTLG